MNRLASIAVMVAMLAVNPAAWADGWHGQGNPGHGNPGHGSPGQWHGSPGQWHGNSGWHGNTGWHGSTGWHGGYRPYPGYGYYRPYYAHGYYPYRPYYYPYRPVGYPYPYYGGYYGGYYPYYQHHNNDNHSDWPAYLAGGLIVGALLTNAYNQSQANVYSYPQASYPQTAPATPMGSVQGRHLLRDLNGKCYERQTDANGNEMRTELPPSECNW